MDPFWYGFFFGPPIILLFIGALAAIFGIASRPHDTRMNTQEMVFKIVARIVDHREWMAQHGHHIEHVAQPVSVTELAEPVKPKQLPMPELIEGVIVYSEAQKNAIVKFAQERALSIYDKP